MNNPRLILAQTIPGQSQLRIKRATRISIDGSGSVKVFRAPGELPETIEPSALSVLFYSADHAHSAIPQFASGLTH
jgi:hypothetical protein